MYLSYVQKKGYTLFWSANMEYVTASLKTHEIDHQDSIGNITFKKHQMVLHHALTENDALLAR